VRHRTNAQQQSSSILAHLLHVRLLSRHLGLQRKRLLRLSANVRLLRRSARWTAHEHTRCACRAVRSQLRAQHNGSERGVRNKASETTRQ
jgi:hypothetical protein